MSELAAPPRILYYMDKSGIASGYQLLFQKMHLKAGIQPREIIPMNVYSSGDDVVKRKDAKSSTWVLNPEKADLVASMLRRDIARLNPSMLVTVCPAVAGVVSGGYTLEQARGGVYDFEGIPVVCTYPINAIHRRKDDRDQDEEGVSKYSVKSGEWILAQDWGKIGRIFSGKQRKIPAFNYSIVRTLADAECAERFLADCLLISTDIETVGARTRTELSCTGYTGVNALGVCRTFVFPLYDRFVDGHCYWDLESHVKIWECIQRINSMKAYFTAHNGSYDMQYLVRDNAPVDNYLLDSSNMWHALYPEQKKNLDFVTSIWQDSYQYWKADIKGLDDKDETKRDTSMEKYWRYNALDCYWTLWNTAFMLVAMRQTPWYQQNFRKEFMLNLGAITMSMRGVKADKKRLMDHRLDLEEKASAARVRFKYLVADEDFNPNSPQQVQWLLYQFLGVPERKVRGKTASTDEASLKLARLDHPLFAVFIDALWEAKKPAKQISNICDMPIYTDRFRTAFGVSTETWRLNSRKSVFWDGTNAQNITKKMRDWLVADEGYVLFDFDYSQSDAVFMAFESNDPEYIKTMTDSRDSHAVHAEEFFQVPYDKIVRGKKADDPFITHPTNGIRNLAKRVVHGSNFQMAATTLYLTMGKEAVIAAAEALGHKDAAAWPEKALIALCDRLLQAYLRKYPGLTKFFTTIKQMLKTGGTVENAFGMKRIIMGDVNDGTTQREATAFFGQSDTAGNMNRCIEEMLFGHMQERFRDGPNPHFNEPPIMLMRDPDFELLLQVHDSFVGQVKIERAHELLTKLLTVMQRPVIINGHEVVVRAEGEVGFRWCKDMIPFNPNDPTSLDDLVKSRKTLSLQGRN